MKSRLTHWFSSRGRSGAPGWKLSRGQSLVEMALTMPLLLLILAGTVEVTNLLTIYNQLQLGVREGARLAAQGAPDTSVLGVLNDSLKNTAVVNSPAYLQAWLVRPRLSSTSSSWSWAGGSTSNWGTTEVCITKAANGIDPNCIAGANPVTPNMIGTQLWTINNASMNNQIFVVLTAKYEAQTILNLKWFGSPTGRFPIYAYNVFRQEVEAKTASQLASGCSVYPIAVEYANIPDEILAENDPIAPININSLPSNKSGYSYLTWKSANSGSLSALQASLGAPGNSLPDVPASNPNAYLSPLSTANQLRRGSWVTYSSISSNGSGTSGVAPQLQDHLDQKRTLRLILYYVDAAVPTTEFPGATASNPQTLTATGKPAYQIAGFVVVRILGFTTTKLTFSYVKTDSSCGYPQ